MKVQVDLTRNVPDFILALDGAPMQDPRFVLLKKISRWRYHWIKFIIKHYDRQKEWLRLQEDLER